LAVAFVEENSAAGFCWLHTLHDVAGEARYFVLATEVIEKLQALLQHNLPLQTE
jgi:hypothetical protein